MLKSQLLLAGFLAFTFIACSEETSSVSPDDHDLFSQSSSSNSENATLIIDQANKTITTYEPYCKNVGGQAVFDPIGDTTVVSYELLGDTLLMNDGSELLLLTGDNNGSLFGKWNATDVKMEGAKVWLEISETAIETHTDFSKVCPAEIIKEYFEDNESLEFVYTDCEHFTLNLAVGGIEVAYDYTYQITADKTVYSYVTRSTISALNGLTCTDTEYEMDITEDLCTTENLDYIEDGTEYVRTTLEGNDCDLTNSAAAKAASGILPKILLK